MSESTSKQSMHLRSAVGRKMTLAVLSGMTSALTKPVTLSAAALSLLVLASLSSTRGNTASVCSPPTEAAAIQSRIDGARTGTPLTAISASPAKTCLLCSASLTSASKKPGASADSVVLSVGRTTLRPFSSGSPAT
eukprot:14843-Heterococcus_DN1.PRE.1